MKGSEKTIFIGVGLLALAAAFYLMILAPKRKEASDLQNQISSLQTSISQENQTADFGEQARQHFPVYYGRLVVLGKAVPAEADTASMLVQLSTVAQRTHVVFGGIKLGSGASGTGSSSAPSTPAPTAPASSTGTTGTTGSTGSTGSSTAPTSTTPSSGATPASSTSSSASTATAAATAVPATESAVASQPIGAVVGPSGLPTLPYSLTFQGDFFDVANFIGGVDGLVDLHHASGQVGADGRLMTVDGFALSLSAKPNKLNADFAVTSYVAPPGLGLTAGASPSGPAPASPVPSQPQTTPTSSTIGR